MPPRKKVKTKQSKSASIAGSIKQTKGTASRSKAVRGRRGGLKDMPNMPLDVLLEIFSFMHPRDLLNLARTNKSFRAFLMSTHAQSLWKASLENIDGLPKCPPYMNEPTYINLLFFNHCHNCLKNNVRVVMFHCSARYCPACRKTMFVDDFDCRRLFKAITSDIGEAPTWFYSFTDSNNLLLHKPEITEFEVRWKGLNSVAAKKDLVLEYKNKRKLIDDASQDFYAWESQQKAKRSDELDEIRAGRLDAIRSRLRDSGWEKELDFIDENPYSRFDLERQKFATRSEPLTERVWQKIEKDVLMFVESVRTQRLANERKARLHDRFSAFAKALKRYQGEDAKRDRGSEFGPQFKDFLLMPDFRTILDSTDMSALDDDDKMRAMFDAGHAKWQGDRRRELCDMLKGSVDSPLDGADLLALAQSLFRCMECRRDGLRYPEVLAHECPRKFSWRSIIGWGAGRVEDVYQHAVATYKHHYRPAWSGEGRLAPSTQAISYARSISRACGFDPDTVTPQEADQCGVRLICRKCDGGPRDPLSDSSFSDDELDDEARSNTRTVYSWSRALAHCIERGVSWAFLSFRGLDHEWERVSDEEAEAVRNFEQELSNRENSIEHDRYRHNCGYCEYVGSWQGMPDHLSNRHDRDVAMDQLAEHCYIRADTDLKPPVIIVKRGDDGSFHVEAREDEQEDDPFGMFYPNFDEWSDDLDLDAAILGLG